LIAACVYILIASHWPPSLQEDAAQLAISPRGQGHSRIKYGRLSKNKVGFHVA